MTPNAVLARVGRAKTIQAFAPTSVPAVVQALGAFGGLLVAAGALPLITALAARTTLLAAVV